MLHVGLTFKHQYHIWLRLFCYYKPRCFSFSLSLLVFFSFSFIRSHSLSLTLPHSTSLRHFRPFSLMHFKQLTLILHKDRHKQSIKPQKNAKYIHQRSGKKHGTQTVIICILTHITPFL